MNDKNELVDQLESIQNSMNSLAELISRESLPLFQESIKTIVNSLTNSDSFRALVNGISFRMAKAMEPSLSELANQLMKSVIMSDGIDLNKDVSQNTAIITHELIESIDQENALNDLKFDKPKKGKITFEVALSIVFFVIGFLFDIREEFHHYEDQESSREYLKNQEQIIELLTDLIDHVSDDVEQSTNHLDDHFQEDNNGTDLKNDQSDSQ